MPEKKWYQVPILYYVDTSFTGNISLSVCDYLMQLPKLLKFLFQTGGANQAKRSLRAHIDKVDIYFHLLIVKFFKFETPVPMITVLPITVYR